MAAVTLAFFISQNSILELIQLDIYFDPARHRQSNEADGKTGEVSKKKFEKKSYFIFLKIIQVHLIQQKVWSEKKWQKIVTNPMQKVSDRYLDSHPA